MNVSEKSLKPCCPHEPGDAFGRACPHVFLEPDDEHNIAFTEQGITYDLVCAKCAHFLEEEKRDFVYLCEMCFYFIEGTGGHEENIFGKPQIRERETQLQFTHRMVTLQGWGNRKLLCLQPENDVTGSQWIALAATGELFRLDFDQNTATSLMQLPDECVDLNQEVALYLSSKSKFAAVVNVKGEKGCVVDLGNKRVTMSLYRGDYHNKHCTFPIAFFESDSRILLVHGTTWNRLDISDPQTGEILTKREQPVYAENKPSEHYLDYFHCGLTISPDNQWIVDNGWVWAPVGIVRSWSLQQWISSNVWESEDGNSVRDLCNRNYFWDGPCCWINERTLAVWGFGGDDEFMIPAVQLFDLESGKRTRWFAGPQGELTFDKYLFSTSQEYGTSVWDIETGERLHHAKDFQFVSYHRGAKQFISYESSGHLQISCL